VNAGLQDVMVLRQALMKHSGISESLPWFERERLPDVRALIRLMQVGYPLQYSQAPFRQRLWSIKLTFQLAMHKVLPSLFYKPLTMNVGNVKLRYRDILCYAERNARRVQVGAMLMGLVSAVTLAFKCSAFRPFWVPPLMAIALPALVIRMTYQKSPLSTMNEAANA